MRSLKKHSESFIWAAAIILLYLPMYEGSSLCLFRFAGFSSCWGCGLGHAIHHALHLDFSASWQEHMLGIPVAISLFYLSIRSFLQVKNKPSI